MKKDMLAPAVRLAGCDRAQAEATLHESEHTGIPPEKVLADHMGPSHP